MSKIHIYNRYGYFVCEISVSQKDILYDFATKKIKFKWKNLNDCYAKVV